MTEPYLAQIKIFAGTFAPRGYALCWGQIIAIQQNTALFSLLGTQYGGNGQTTFALPDLRGRTPLGQGSGAGLSPYVVGEQIGTENETIISTEMPMHNHQISGAVVPNTNTVNTPGPTSMFSNATPNKLYAVTNANLLQLAPQSITFVGGNQSHNNRQPYLALNFIIATSGIFPARN